MKRIWVMRHAKSDWSDDSRADFDRPLNKRGKTDAPRMGRWIAAHGGPPDRIAASPARRARDTAEQVAEAAGCPAEAIDWRAEFYPGEAGAFLRYLRDLPEEVGHVLVIGHNPSLETLVALLAGGGAAVRLPTAAVALLQSAAARWREIGPGGAELEGLVSPKMLD